MNKKFLKMAKEESKKSDMDTKVGAVLVLGNDVIKGHNRKKTHPEFANPEKHVRKSLHAELDCLIKARNRKFPDILMTGGVLYISRSVKDVPAMARPCEHCMSFLRKAGIKRVIYSTSYPPFTETEEL